MLLPMSPELNLPGSEVVQPRRTGLRSAFLSRPCCGASLHGSRRKVGSRARCQASTLQRSNTLPGEDGWPVLGETLDFLFAKYGPIWRSHILGAPLVVVNDAQESRRLLNAEHRLVESFWPQSMQKLLGPHSLLVAPQQRHKRLRGILQQAFTEAAIQSYMPTIVEVVEGTLARWAATPAQPILLSRAARILAFDVAAAVLLGTRFDGPKAEALRTHFEVYSDGLVSLPFNLPGTKFGRAMRARNSILEDIKDIIEAADQALAQNPRVKGLGPRPNALQTLLQARDEEGNKASLDDMKDQVLTQLFAGHETSGSLLWSLVVELQRSPHVLQRLREEQASPGSSLPDSAAAGVGQGATPYAEAVLKEGLRMHSIVDGVWRRSLEDLDIAGYHVPKGTTVQLMVGRTAQTEQAWLETVKTFDPERWLDGGTTLKRKEPATYQPWGEGPRKCLGMLLARAEILVFLGALARGYEFQVVDPDEPLGVNAKPIYGQPTHFWKQGDSKPPIAAKP